jgi:hypothetical protein
MTSITLHAPLVIFTIHTCSYVQQHFLFAPVHTSWHRITGIGGPSVRPAGGGIAICAYIFIYFQELAVDYGSFLRQ